MSGFAIPACAACGHAVWPPHLACAVCGAAEWTEVDASTGTLEELIEAPGYDGTPVRLGTIRLEADGGGPPVIATVEGDAAVGDTVELRLDDGALRAAQK